MMRAPRCTSMPTYPSSAALVGSPVCNPIRIDTGPARSALWMSAAAVAASDARRERDEEGVSLGVDLDASISSDHLPHELSNT